MCHRKLRSKTRERTGVKGKEEKRSGEIIQATCLCDQRYVEEKAKRSRKWIKQKGVWTLHAADGDIWIHTGVKVIDVTSVLLFWLSLLHGHWFWLCYYQLFQIRGRTQTPVLHSLRFIQNTCIHTCRTQSMWILPWTGRINGACAHTTECRAFSVWTLAHCI